MANTAQTLVLPQDLQEFAEQRVRSGSSLSVADVVREALEDKRRAVLREAVDAGITELDAGLGVETSPDELMAEIYADVDSTP